MGTFEPLPPMIDRIFALGPKELLTNGGFRQDGWTFARPVNDLLHVIRFVYIEWDEPFSRRLTPYLLVAVPQYDSFFPNRPSAKKPESLHAFCAKPIRDLVPEADEDLWEVSEDTDPAALGGEIAESIERFGMPYLDSFGSISEMLVRWPAPTGLIEGDGEIVERAILNWCIGRVEEARTILETARADPSAKVWHTRIGLALKQLERRQAASS